jgi:hypothetical protein
VKFDSGVFAKGKSFTYTFTKSGVYNYYCAAHPDMKGAITVTDTAPAGAPAPTKIITDHSGYADNAARSAPAASDPVSGALDPFMAHLQAAHFNKGVGAQVQDIAEFDAWAKTHQALFRQMLDYEVGPGSVASASSTSNVFMQHMDNAHWNRSPMGQVSDISNFDSWNKSHLALFRMMFDPVVGKSSALGTSPGTSVFMQHMDAAHWNQSLNGQATAATDDFPAWTASHAAMFQAMIQSLATSGH